MWHRNIQGNQTIERQTNHDLPIFVLPLLRRYDKLLFNQLVDDIKQQFSTCDTRTLEGKQRGLVLTHLLIRRYVKYQNVENRCYKEYHNCGAVYRSEFFI